MSEIIETVKKPTRLVTLKNTLTALEHKLFNLSLKMALDGLEKYKETGENKFFITYKEIRHLTGISDNREIRKNLGSLRRKDIESKGELLTDKDKKYTIVDGYINKWGFDEDEQEIYIKMNDSILDMISENEYRFARLNLDDMKGLKQKHALWLYELAISLKKTATFTRDITYSIDDLRTLSGIDEKQYKMSKDFVQKVIKKGVDDVNENTSIQIDYTSIKKSRKIESIKFKFRLKNEKEMDFYKFKGWVWEQWNGHKQSLGVYDGAMMIFFKENNRGTALMWELFEDPETKKVTSNIIPTNEADVIYEYLYKNKELFFQISKDRGLFSGDENF